MACSDGFGGSSEPGSSQQKAAEEHRGGGEGGEGEGRVAVEDNNRDVG